MKKLPDSPKSSLQRLRPILAGALQDKFKSRLWFKRGRRSEEIVNAIVLELETYLVDLTSETIDQVSGRLETRLNEFFSGSGSKNASEKPELQDEDVEAVKEDLSSSAQEGDSDLIDAICRVLNGINKENKLKNLRKYLQKEAGKKKKERAKARKKANKKADKEADKESLETLKASFDSGGYEAFFKIILNIDDICKQTSKVLEKTVARHMRVQREINNTLSSVVKKLDRARAVHRRLDRSITALAKSNLALAYSRVKLALVNIALAVSNVALAASNFILAAAIIVYAVTMLIYSSAMLLKAATLVILAAVVAVMYVALAAVIIAFSLVAAAILVVGIALVIGFMILLAASLLVMVLTVAVVLALVFVSLAVALAVIVVTAAVFALSLMVSVALVIAAGLVVAAAVAVVVVASALLLGTILNVAILAITAELASLAAVIGMVAYALLKVGTVILVGFTAVSLAIVGVVGGMTYAAVAAVGVLLTAAMAGFAALFAASHLALGAVSGLLVIMFTLIVYSLQSLFFKGRDALMKWWDEKGSVIWENIRTKCIPMVDSVVDLIDSWIMGGKNGEKSVWDKIMDHMKEVESVGLFKYVDNRAREQPKSSTMGKVVDAVDKMDTSNCDKLGQQLQNMEGEDGYIKNAEKWVSKTWDFIKGVLSSLRDGLRWVEDNVGNYGIYGWIMENVTQATMGYSRQQELLDQRLARQRRRRYLEQEGRREENTRKARSLYDKVRVQFPLEDAIDSLSPEAALNLDMAELLNKKGGRYYQDILKGEKAPTLKNVWHFMQEVGLYKDKAYDEIVDLYLDKDPEFMKYYDAMCARLDHMRAAYQICVAQVRQNVPKTVDSVVEKAKENEKARKVDSDQQRERLMKEREERRKKQK